jgi:DUF4097 and DUF4098 domain-containing protein YvlB
MVTGEPGVVKVGISGSGEGDVAVDLRGSTVSIASKRQGRFIMIDRNIYATVEVPPGTDVRANVASADLTCDTDLSHITFHSASGDLRFTSVVELEAKTASGDLRGTSVHERLSFVSASGDIYLGELHGRAEVSTASGDMHVDKVSGPIQVSTMSGDVHIGEFTGDEVTCKSMSGNVRLGVLRGTRVDLDANSLSGKIRLPERKATNYDMEPTTRATRIQVRLVSGDLRIERA